MRTATAVATRPELDGVLALGDRVRLRLQAPGALSAADVADYDRLLALVDDPTREALKTSFDLRARVFKFAARLRDEPRPLDAVDEAERLALDASAPPALKAEYQELALRKSYIDRDRAKNAAARAAAQALRDRWTNLPMGERMLWLLRERSADKETRRLLREGAELLAEGEEAIRALPMPEDFGK